MTACRVCGHAGVTSLPVAVYAPFFSLRVDTSRDRHALYSQGGMLPLQARSLTARLRRFGARQFAKVGVRRAATILRTSCNFCTVCSSLTLSHRYSYEDLTPLYADYRSASYNRDRISVEPEYAPVADHVGRDPIERASRNDGVAGFLVPFLPPDRDSLALDLGGSDGKFIPPEVMDHHRETHIFDTSDAEVDPSVRSHRVLKISNPAPAQYALLMCMHVLEHVGNPRDFVIDALKYLKPGGLLYLEVPLELQADVASQFAARNVDRHIMVHEHINQYSPDSVAKLIESIPSLKLVRNEAANIDCGWSTGRVGRYLAQRVD